jgi:hypothetical protein
MAVPAAPDPQPRDRPLTERERRALSDPEAHTMSQDPALSLRMRRTRARWHEHLSSRALNASIQAGVVLLVAVVVLPPAWAWGLVVVAVVALLALSVTVAIRRGVL